MKPRSIILISIFALMLSGGCTPKARFEIKMTLKPLAGTAASTPDDLSETVSIIKRRLINYGIPLENISLATTAERINLTIIKIDTAKIKVIENLVTVQGKIEFWETYENGEIIRFISEANTLLAEMKVNKEEVNKEQPAVAVKEDTIHKDGLSLTDLIDEDTITDDDTAGTASLKEFKLSNPLFGILIPRVNQSGEPIQSCLVGLTAITDTAKVNSYLKMPVIEALFPRDLKFYWSWNPYPYDESKSLYELHAVRVTSISGQPALDGSVIMSAKVLANKYGTDNKLSISMNAEGARMWARITKDNIDRCIAVVLDDYVRSYPRVSMEITGGNSEITGDFSLTEVQYLAAILNSGGSSLPVKLKIADEQIVKTE